MWLDHIVARNRTRWPERTALLDARRRVSWAELDRDIDALAVAMRQTAAPGSRVAVVSGNRVEFLEAYFAAARAEVIAVPINPALADPEIAYILDSVDPALALVDNAGAERIAAVRGTLPTLSIEDVETLPDAVKGLRSGSLGLPVAILHTSATTGKPKGVVVDQRSFQLNATSWLADVGVPEGTVFLNACPLFHGSMVIALDYLAAGATVGVLDRFTPQGCLRAIESWRVTHAFLVPSMVRLVLDCQGLAETDLSSLDLLLHGAAPMPDELAKQAEVELGTALQTIYGITEGGGPVVTLRPDDQPEGAPVPGAVCVGRPMLGTSLRITGPDEIGEIELAGDGLMQGYWRNAMATGEALTAGWLNTHDLGCVDQNGYVWIVDRRNDLILRGGQNVYPAEIEHVLRQSPAVRDVAVVPAASETWGQTPVAFVVAAEGSAFDEVALIQLCVRALAAYKRPSRFVRIDEIPRNPAGKILRAKLRELAARTGAEGENQNP